MKTNGWYVEQDGHGPYVCENRMGRVATIEPSGLKTNGNRLDWQRARLIAAAPELLEALEEMTDMFTRNMLDKPGPDDAAQRWDNAVDAIAKATGGDA